jgi:inorganic phosphate transporter, PiT family
MLPLLVACLFLAYANGGNDNFKGVATLYGSRVLSYRQSLALATSATFAGSLAGILIGYKLLKLFSGSGTVSSAVLNNPHFLISVAIGAAITVFLATVFGFPVSTTHGLVGGLIGAGVISGGLLSARAILQSFFIPLLASPFVAAGLTVILYRLFHATAERLGIESDYCLCVGQRQEAVAGPAGFYAIPAAAMEVTLAEESVCRSTYSGTIAGINVEKLMNGAHILSAGALCFARALNDTPKIAAMLLLLSFLQPSVSITIVAVFMVIGGCLHSRGVARRMSLEITEMNGGLGFTGNIISAMLVIAGSFFGLPLSTTHISCGALFGVGMVTGRTHKATVVQIVMAWLLTLPIAALLSVACWLLLNR